jgi:deaminated glutathione amidase
MSYIAAIQMTSGANLEDNLLIAEALIAEATKAGATLIVLPENFSLMSQYPEDKLKYREYKGQGVVQAFLHEKAKQYNTWIVGGTIPLAVADDETKVFVSTLVYNNRGECIARYDKIHLFDVEIPGNKEVYSESQTTKAGRDVLVVDTPFGRMGVAICYDLRFPELFRLMHREGVELIVLPAAFTFATGTVHWEILIKARAIENQVYFIASAQTGHHENNRKTFGHSMIVNPWGKVLSLLPEGPGYVIAPIDLTYLHQLRNDFPVLKHRKT